MLRPFCWTFPAVIKTTCPLASLSLVTQSVGTHSSLRNAEQPTITNNRAVTTCITETRCSGRVDPLHPTAEDCDTVHGAEVTSKGLHRRQFSVTIGRCVDDGTVSPWWECRRNSSKPVSHRSAGSNFSSGGTEPRADCQRSLGVLTRMAMAKCWSRGLRRSNSCSVRMKACSRGLGCPSSYQMWCDFQWCVSAYAALAEIALIWGRFWEVGSQNQGQDVQQSVGRW